MKNYILMLFLFLGVAVEAQEGKIQGVIQQEEIPVTIPGVNVYLQNTSIGTATNSSGYFELEGVPVGDYILVASVLGFKEVKMNVTISKDKAELLEIKLEESVTDLPAVVVEGSSLTGGLSGLKELPGSAQYISPKELDRFEYADINRVLASVPGIHIQEEDGFGLRPNIGFRGTGVERSSKISIMEDGVLAAPAPYAAPAAYYFPTIGRMQAVEILKGASQVKYGPYTTGGALNLISTQIPHSFSGQFKLFGGNFGYRNLHASVGNSYKNMGFVVESYMEEATGFKTLPNQGNTGFDKKDFMAKVRFNTDPEAEIYQSISFKIGQTYETSDETYLGLTQADFEVDPFQRYAASQTDQMNTNHRQLQVRYVIQPSANINITATAYRNDFHRNWYKLDKIQPNDSTAVSVSALLESPENYSMAMAIAKGETAGLENALLMKNNNRDYFLQGVQVAGNFYYRTGDIHHKTQLGVRYHQDQIDRYQWVDEFTMENGAMQLTEVGVPGTESNRIETADAVAAYVMHELKWKKFTFTPGIRYENILLERKDFGKKDINRTGIELKERSNQVEVWIPGIGVNYDVNMAWNVFAGVHKGFSPPGNTEETLPESSINYEIGTRYFQNSLLVQVVAFYNDYSNLLGSDLAAVGGTGSTDLFNGGEATVWGLEANAEYDIIGGQNSKWGLPVSLTYTYSNARFDNDFDSDFKAWGNVSAGDFLPYVAPHRFSATAGLTHSRFEFFITGRYVDAMRTVAGQGSLIPSLSTEPHFVSDVSAAWRLGRHATLFGSILNVTDEVYIAARRPAGVRPGMPRMFKLGVKANF